MIHRNRFPDRLFLALTLVSVLVTLIFGIYENRRERLFRCDILHARLQLNNYRVMHASPKEADSTIRVTLIDTLGRVVSDSETPDVAHLPNHLQRHEVQEALRNGNGYDIKRTSSTLRETFFYSATYFPSQGLVVRSAVPYDAPLTASLEHDYTFYYYTAGILVLISIVLYLRRRLSSSEQDKQRLKRQLTENAAHELKTPATTIEGYLDTLVSHPEMAADTRMDFLRRCHRQSIRMSRLLADMSMLTRLDEAHIQRPKATIDLAGVIREVAEEARPQLDEHGISLQLQVPSTLPMQGDAALIYSLVRNVVDNTLGHAVGATKFVVAANERGRSSVVLSFSDNGQGVPPEHLPHLFERFYRVDAGRSRRMGGTGLGLAIVKNIALQYGGSVSAALTPGGGLTLTIALNRQ